MPTLVVYITGHGLGHTTRVMEVIETLWEREPPLTVHIRSAVMPEVFRENLRGPFTHHRGALDVGAIQHDTLHSDLPATLAACQQLVTESSSLIDAETRALEAHRPAAVLADIPALAFGVADKLGIPGIAMGNFCWDWIYQDFAQRMPAFGDVAQHAASLYGRCTKAFRLPFHGPFDAFPDVEDVGLIARRSHLPRTRVRSLLGWQRSERVVLLSFGGIGIRGGAIPLVPITGTRFILVGAAWERTQVPPTVEVLDFDQMRTHNIRYQDVLAASDLVMTKPGYGILAECYQSRVPILYTPRHDFIEYGALLSALQSHFACAELSNTDLFAGRWAGAIDQALAARWPDSRLPQNGAHTIADYLLAQT